jgi:hypothetical protein
MKRTFKRDWRRPGDYASLKNYSLEEWAWEFLRRNPEYCREYRELTEGLTEDQKAMKSVFSIGCRKWGLYSWLDPEREYSNIRFIPPGGTQAVISSLDFPKRKGVVFLMAGKETGKVLFRFDTRNPINPQIEAAKKELLALQRNQTGERQTIFKPRYGIELLRVLDATAEGHRPKAIAEAFYPDEKITSTGGTHGYRNKEISDKIKQATRYASHDYRLIPFPTK